MNGTKLSSNAPPQSCSGFVITTSEVIGIEDNDWFVGNPGGDKGLTLTIELRFAIVIKSLPLS